MIKGSLKILFFILSLQIYSQDLAVMTYNIRLDVDSDKENAWPHRQDFLLSMLRFYSPDVFGIQEGLPHQVSFINEQLSNYSYVGMGREGGNKGEYAAIFYDTTYLSIKTQGTFWLSTTPNEYSLGWDAALPRICTYALFEQKKSGIRFWVFNTHFDHIGIEARTKSSELILSKIRELNSRDKLPVVLMGDFNAVPESQTIHTIKRAMNDTREVSISVPFGPEGTFNGFEFGKTNRDRIDYVFVSKSMNIQVDKYGILNNSKDLRYPSDHFPVYVELEIKNKPREGI